MKNTLVWHVINMSSSTFDAVFSIANNGFVLKNMRVNAKKEKNPVHASNNTSVDKNFNASCFLVSRSYEEPVYPLYNRSHDNADANFNRRFDST
jgi:hypothetical protein